VQIIKTRRIRRDESGSLRSGALTSFDMAPPIDEITKSREKEKIAVDELHKRAAFRSILRAA
jgi:hypothetical protein